MELSKRGFDAPKCKKMIIQTKSNACIILEEIVEVSMIKHKMYNQVIRANYRCKVVKFFFLLLPRGKDPSVGLTIPLRPTGNACYEFVHIF